MFTCTACTAWPPDLVSEKAAAVAIPIAVALGASVALAGASGGADGGVVPTLWLIVAGVFVVQWIAFVPAFLAQTERFFDLTGSLTFIGAAVSGVLLSSGGTAPLSLLLAFLVVAWAVRLGTFLARRVHADGGDSRFDDIKPSFLRFLNVWTLQGLWVTVTASAALTVIASDDPPAPGAFSLVGALVWAFGFIVEIVADAQKRRFRSDPANRGDFIRTGLWAWSRHPNYFGEIVLWLGIAIVAAPALQGWQYVTLVSPVFVTLLLTRVSGIPMLESAADERWGGRPEYERYKANTPVLVPRPPSA